MKNRYWQFHTTRYGLAIVHCFRDFAISHFASFLFKIIHWKKFFLR